MLWGALVVAARQVPGAWFTPLSNVPLATVRAIRERRHPDLRVAGGRLEARAINVHIRDGRSFCDCQVRWMGDSHDPEVD